MNYNEIVCEYINKCNLDEPLFLEEIKQYVINKYKNDDINSKYEDIIKPMFIKVFIISQ